MHTLPDPTVAVDSAHSSVAFTHSLQFTKESKLRSQAIY